MQPENTSILSSCSSALVFVEGFCFKPQVCHRRRQIKEGKGERGVWGKGKWGEKPDSIDGCVSKDAIATLKGIVGG